MRSPKTFRITGAVCLLIGAALLGLAVVGEWTPWGGGYGYPKRAWERFNPALVERIDNYEALSRAIDKRLSEGQRTDAEKVKVMYDLISERFTHDEAAHTPTSNWILYSAGFLHPTFRHIWSPDEFVAHGYSLLCDQSSYLLLKLVRERGMEARHVGLQGHVVMEVWYEGDWHLYDPDLEVLPLNETGEVLSISELARNEPLLQKYYGPHTDMADLLRHRENHLFMSTPEGARFEWKGNLLAIMEQVMEVLEFIIPVLLLGFGYWLARRGAEQRAPEVERAGLLAA